MWKVQSAGAYFAGNATMNLGRSLFKYIGVVGVSRNPPEEIDVPILEAVSNPLDRLPDTILRTVVQRAYSIIELPRIHINDVSYFVVGCD